MWMNAFVGSYDSSITNKMVKIVVAIAFFPFWLRFSFSGTMKKKNSLCSCGSLSSLLSRYFGA